LSYEVDGEVHPSLDTFCHNGVFEVATVEETVVAWRLKFFKKGEIFCVSGCPVVVRQQSRLEVKLLHTSKTKHVPSTATIVNSGGGFL